MTMMVTEIVCEGHFGWTFTFLLSVVGMAYVGGGIAWGKHTGRVTATSGHPTMQLMQAHPHHSRWQDLRGLCMDGVRFAKGGRGTQYSRIRDAPASQTGSKIRQDERARREEPLQQKQRSAKRKNGDGGGVGKEKRGKGAHKSAKENKTSKPDKQKKDGAAIEDVREPETVGETKERLLREQRDDGAHSSQQRIKVVGING
eukprot:COSAG02_NODE_10296_length_1975_cov_3.396055_2_plen_201_part_00